VTDRDKSPRQELSLDQIDLNLLRIFDILMQERSVTKTAQRTGRTQSAVSHSLGKLREIFQDELFSRDAMRMEPTLRALELATVISASLSDIRHVIDRHMHFEPAETRRNFRVGLSDYTAATFLPSLIERFAAAAPHATLNVLHTRQSEVTSLLKARAIECAVLGNVMVDDDERIGQVVLSVDKMVCAGWSGNPALTQLTLERYLEASHLQISADGVGEGLSDAALRQMDLKRKVVATVPHYLVAPWILKGTQLLTAFGDSLVLALDSASETYVVAPPFDIPDVTVALLFERRLEADLGCRWLRSLIEEISVEQRARKASLLAKTQGD
jgi:DNA-binding transcriptional LysR family regulator